MNIIQIYNRFPTQQDCIEYLEIKKWEGVPCCPYCNSQNHTPMPKENRYHCNTCNTSYSVMVNTVFQNTKLPFQKWFLAISLIMDAKKSMSARQLARHIEVTKDTAWSMLMRIRKNLTDYEDLLQGIVESDETFIGGKNKNRHSNKKIDGGQGGNSPDKTIVHGLIERGSGKVKAVKVGNRKGKTLKANINKNVVKGSTVMTDEFKAYNGLDKTFDHQACNHSQGEYVIGDAHCNTMENFWSLFKRGFHGQWHQLSSRYLDLYLGEFAFRYEHRNNTDIFNLTLTKALGL